VIKKRNRDLIFDSVDKKLRRLPKKVCAILISPAEMRARRAVRTASMPRISTHGEKPGANRPSESRSRGLGASVVRKIQAASRLAFFLSALRFKVAVIFKGLRNVLMLRLFSRRDWISRLLRAHADVFVFAIGDITLLNMGPGVGTRHNPQ
jgi:hypothetical protein